MSPWLYLECVTQARCVSESAWVPPLMSITWLQVANTSDPITRFSAHTLRLTAHENWRLARNVFMSVGPQRGVHIPCGPSAFSDGGHCRLYCRSRRLSGCGCTHAIELWHRCQSKEQFRDLTHSVLRSLLHCCACYPPALAVRCQKMDSGRKEASAVALVVWSNEADTVNWHWSLLIASGKITNCYRNNEECSISVAKHAPRHRSCATH